jgi:hypothetical protein
MILCLLTGFKSFITTWMQRIALVRKDYFMVNGFKLFLLRVAHVKGVLFVKK